MTSNIIYNKLLVRLEKGQVAFSDGVSLERGTCVGIYFLPIKGADTQHFIEIDVQNSQNGVVLTPTDFRDYLHKGGGYFSGLKPVNFPTENNRFFVSVNSSKPVAEEFLGQLIFVIQK